MKRVPLEPAGEPPLRLRSVMLAVEPDLVHLTGGTTSLLSACLIPCPPGGAGEDDDSFLLARPTPGRRMCPAVMQGGEEARADNTGGATPRLSGSHSQHGFVTGIPEARLTAT
jgi:hypothetical protein